MVVFNASIRGAALIDAKISTELWRTWVARLCGNQYGSFCPQRQLSTSRSLGGPLEYMPSNRQVSRDGNRPISVIYGWLLAKSRHLDKFAEIYNDHGADVVTVKPRVTEVLQPRKAENLTARLLDILQSPEHEKRPILVHGFSVGGYMYSQTLNHIVTSSKYSTVGDRIIGQILDSPVDCNNIPYGVSNAATDRALLRNTIRLTIELYFKTTRKHTMDKFTARSELFFSNPVRAPALVVFSKDDPVAFPENCEQLITTWRNDLGMDVTEKKWDSSPHVSHFYKHQEEYLQLMSDFLKKVGLVQTTMATKASS